MKANAEHFWKAFDHCVTCCFTKQQAMVMAKGFSNRGFVDASEGCSHYALFSMYIDNALDKKIGEIQNEK